MTWASRCFDLANNYGPPDGSAEETFGRILREDLGQWRDEMIITTKAGYYMWPGPYGEWGSRKYLLASLDQSLKRMGLDYVDIFYSHRPDPDTPLEETMGALAHAVRSGKALYAGISNYQPAETVARGENSARTGHAVPHPSAALQHVGPLGRTATARHAGSGRHRLHRFLAAGEGPVDRPLFQGHSRRFARGPRSDDFSVPPTSPTPCWRKRKS